MRVCNLSLLNLNHSHWFPKRRNRWEHGASVFNWPYFNQLGTYVLRKDVGMCLNKAERDVRGEEIFRMWMDRLPAVSSLGLFSVHTQPWCLFLFSQGRRSYGIRAPPLWLHLTLIICFKVQSPNTTTSGVRASTHEFLRGHTIQFITQISPTSSFSHLCSSCTWKEHHSYQLCSLNSSSYKARSGLCFDRVFPIHPSLRTLHAPLHHINCIIPSNCSYLFRCLSPCLPPPTPTYCSLLTTPYASWEQE